MATVTALPTTALVDDPVSIRVSGLKGNEQVTLSCHLCESNKHFESFASYQADEDGNIDLAVQASLRGSYQRGVEPMGLIWSMRANWGQPLGLRFIKHNVEKPLEFLIKVHPGHTYDPKPVDCNKVQNSSDDNSKSNERTGCGEEPIIAQTKFYRYYLAKGVRCQDVYDGTLRGKIFIPKGEGPFPAVIDMFGTSGGLQTFRSALLASRGIMSYALPYFAYQDLPSEVIIRYEYFEEAIDFLYNHPLAIKTGIGVIGVSKGGHIALEMATRSDKVLVCVAINSLYFHAIGKHFYKGKPQPCYNPPMELILKNRQFEGVVLAKSVTINEENYNEVKDAIIKFETSPRANFLFITGDDDFGIDPAHVSYMEKKLYDNNMGHRCSSLFYEGAGHLIEPPHTPYFRTCYSKYFDSVCLFGGYPKYHAVAQEDSWKYMLAFIRHKIDPSCFNLSPPVSKYLRNPLGKL